MYNNQVKEFIKYVLLQENMVLTEHRLADAGHAEEAVLIPGGGIEEFDHHVSQNAREVALLREINEELQGQVTATEYHYLGEIFVPERKFLFHCYLITTWEGTIPEYIIEEGETDAKLSWVDKDKLLQQTNSRVNKFILEKLNLYLQK